MERLDAHTPMMQQYPHYKERHPDNFLFCRMGDSNEQLHDAAEHAQQHHGD